ncbi:MAG: NERD domain-containing protein [Nocardia sp.]|nr:NERD domain-containing protein [Nocardia sp.]
MLVRIQNAAGSLAERTLITWLRTWKGPGSPHGVATVNCSLFHEDRLHQFDAVIWTPTTCVVIEAVALVQRLDGEIEVPWNGPWRVRGQLVTFEGEGRGTPLERSHEHTHALQNWLAESGLGQRVVHGVVVVIPPAGSHPDIRQLWTDPGFQVIPGDGPKPLVQTLNSLSATGRAEWTVNEIALTFRGLSILPHLPSPQDLIGEGFRGRVDTTLWYGGPQQAQAESYAEEQAQQRVRAPVIAAMPWYSPWSLYPREEDRIDPHRVVLRVLLAIGMLVAIVWAVWFVIAAAWTYGPL